MNTRIYPYKGAKRYDRYDWPEERPLRADQVTFPAVVGQDLKTGTRWVAHDTTSGEIYTPKDRSKARVCTNLEQVNALLAYCRGYTGYTRLFVETTGIDTDES